MSFLDADDRWLSDKLEVKVAALRADLSLDGVRPRIREFVSPDITGEAAAAIRAHSTASLGFTATQRREGARSNGSGGFTTEVRLRVGVDFSTRWEDEGFRSLVLDQVLIERRLHSSNNWTREPGRVSDLARTVKATLDRRRAAQSVVKPSESDG